MSGSDGGTACPTGASGVAEDATVVLEGYPTGAGDGDVACGVSALGGGVEGCGVVKGEVTRSRHEDITGLGGGAQLKGDCPAKGVGDIDGFAGNHLEVAQGQIAEAIDPDYACLAARGEGQEF